MYFLGFIELTNVRKGVWNAVYLGFIELTNVRKGVWNAVYLILLTTFLLDPTEYLIKIEMKKMAAW